MAKVFIEETTLTAIGDAIRGKEGTTALVPVNDMASRISAISGGGGDGDITAEDLTFTGNCSNLNQKGNWDWIFERFSNKVTFSGLTSMYYLFSESKLNAIPFMFNVSNCNSFEYAFNNCNNLTVCPKIRGTLTFNTSLSFKQLITSSMLRNVDDLFDPDMLDGWSTVKVTSTYSAPKPTNLGSLSSLRTVPQWLYKLRLCEDSTVYPASSYTLYYELFAYCYTLDEIRDIPVWKCKATSSSNMFTSAFKNCYRLKSLTFETNSDGTPKVTEWKSQVIDLSINNYIGFNNGTYTGHIINYNSGITADKQVNDDATYQALKNDPDWFSTHIYYSRYNHDSAVETINSLPDTSATGTNTIKFARTSGQNTDGGAIGNLTEEEIAVATAKGWTVTFA